MSLSLEAKVMTSWIAGNFADTFITLEGVRRGFSELSPLNSRLFAQEMFEAQIIQKIGLAVLLAGFYALAAKYPKGRRINYKYVADKVMAAGNLIIWGGVMVNTARILADHFTR